MQSAQVIVDRDTNRSKGFAFVEMGTEAEAQAAIEGLNGRDHDGRNLTVNEAKPREARTGGGGGYGGGRSGGGYGGGRSLLIDHQSQKHRGARRCEPLDSLGQTRASRSSGRG